MSTRKRNEFLEASGSEDEGGSQGYDSEAEDFQKGRTTKRRKVESDVSDDEDDAALSDAEEELSEADNGGSETKDITGSKSIKKTVTTGTPSDDDNEIAPTKAEKSRDFEHELPGISKPLTKKNLVATDAAVKRSGVVYLSRIPPFMKPQKLRSLLEPYGTINRIFLTPEDPTSHSRRVKSGGNKKRSFVDGWVEFVSKANAKKACELLNARTIGGKKGTFYHDDVWNLLYLKGFKWNNLTEQISAENAERASRMRAEISRTTKENREFVLNVERSKMLEGMEAKKAAKRRKEADEMPAGDLVKPAAVAKEKAAGKRERGERARTFTQTAVAQKKAPKDQPEEVKRVLSKIF